MISLVVVLTEAHERMYYKNFLKNVLNKAEKISEIIVVYSDKKGNNLAHQASHKLKNGNIVTEVVWHGFQDFTAGLAHAKSLHYGLEKTNNEYVLFSDPDICIFKNGWDSFYLSLMEKYKLQIVGISHYRREAMGTFPCVMNCLLRKDSLPSSDWLKDELKNSVSIIKSLPKKYVSLYIDDTKGIYLSPGIIEKYKNLFPYPETELFDVGCHLYTWNKLTNSKYISFGVASNKREDFLIKTNKCFTNLEEPINFDNEVLLYNFATSRIAYTQEFIDNKYIDANSYASYKK